MAIEMNIQSDDINRIVESLKRYPEESRKEFNSAIEKSVLQVKREAMRRSPVKKGRMKSSIGHKVYSRDLSGEAYVGVKYAVYFHPPYNRRPRAGGVGESRFMIRAVEASLRTISGFFERAVENVIKKI
jgi:hypothetical protein